MAQIQTSFTPDHSVQQGRLWGESACVALGGGHCVQQRVMYGRGIQGASRVARAEPPLVFRVELSHGGAKPRGAHRLPAPGLSQLVDINVSRVDRLQSKGVAVGQDGAINPARVQSAQGAGVARVDPNAAQMLGAKSGAGGEDKHGCEANR